MLLDKQIAVITGGSSGIGKAASILFAKEGATVIFLDKSPSGEKVAQQIEQQGGTACFIECDLTNQDDLQQALLTIIDPVYIYRRFV